jgi:hypothetical protein
MLNLWLAIVWGKHWLECQLFLIIKQVTVKEQNKIVRLRHETGKLSSKELSVC